MARRVKLTAFSRFLILLIFLVPGAYIGASYYNGQDGIQNIKEMLGMEEETSKPSPQNVTKETRKKTTSTSKSTNTGTYTNKDLEARIEVLEKDNALLRKELLKIKTEIATLKSK